MSFSEPHACEALLADLRFGQLKRQIVTERSLATRDADRACHDPERTIAQARNNEKNPVFARLLASRSC